MVLNMAGPLVRGESPAVSSSTEWSDGLSVSEIAEVNSEEFTNREREFLGLIQKLETEVHSRVSMERSTEELEMKYHSAKEERNRYEAEYEVLSALCAKAGTEFQEKQKLLTSQREEVAWLKELDTAFGLTGVQVSSGLHDFL